MVTEEGVRYTLNYWYMTLGNLHEVNASLALEHH